MKNTLRLRLKVQKVEGHPDGRHVHIDAILQAQYVTEDLKEPTKERIVSIGLPHDDEKLVKELAKQAVGSVQELLEKQGFMLPIQVKPLEALVCFYMTKEHFNYLGRPTLDDIIELNARTDRGR